MINFKADNVISSKFGLDLEEIKEMKKKPHIYNEFLQPYIAHEYFSRGGGNPRLLCKKFNVSWETIQAWLSKYPEFQLECRNGVLEFLDRLDTKIISVRNKLLHTIEDEELKKVRTAIKCLVEESDNLNKLLDELAPPNSQDMLKNLKDIGLAT